MTSTPTQQLRPATHCAAAPQPGMLVFDTASEVLGWFEGEGATTRKRIAYITRLHKNTVYRFFNGKYDQSIDNIRALLDLDPIADGPVASALFEFISRGRRHEIVPRGSTSARELDRDGNGTIDLNDVNRNALDSLGQVTALLELVQQGQRLGFAPGQHQQLQQTFNQLIALGRQGLQQLNHINT